MKKKLSMLAAALLAVAIFAGCTGGSQPPAATTAAQETTAAQTTTAAPTTTTADDRIDIGDVEEVKDITDDMDISGLTLKDSPFLQGKGLPPVKDRLPKIPKLTNDIPADKMDFKVGKHGGTLRMVTSVVNWDADVFVLNNTPLLNSPGVEGREVSGNVLQGYEVSDDLKEFTFHMREGLRWSDGNPVVIEDVRFTIEEMILNEEYTPTFPQWMRSGGQRDGQPVKFSVVDDWTFKMTFDEPYGGLLIRLSVNGWRGYTEWIKPSHYLKQFHKDFATDEEKGRWDELCDKYNIAKGEEKTWVLLMTQMNVNNWDCTNRKAVGFPTLHPWMMVESTESVNYYERNPYYFKIDEEGNQLPYIDKIESYLVADMEMVQLKALAGEVDFMRESASLVNMSMYKDAEKENGVISVYMCNMHVTPTDIALNLTYDGGPGYRDTVMDVRFRRALSHAINKDEINDSLYYGYATVNPHQPGYDPAKAEELFKDMGMEKGANGFYKQPDGNPLQILIEVGAEAPDIVPMSELVIEMWRAVGIDASFKRIETSLVGRKQNANELQGRIIWTSYPHWPYMDYGMNLWGRLWIVWRDNITEYTVNNDDGTSTVMGIRGEEPPQEVKEFYELVARQNVAAIADANKLYDDIKKNIGDNVWFIVPFENVKQPLVVNSKLQNVTDKTYAIGVNFSGPQLWYDN